MRLTTMPFYRRSSRLGRFWQLACGGSRTNPSWRQRMTIDAACIWFTILQMVKITYNAPLVVITVYKGPSVSLRAWLTAVRVLMLHCLVRLYPLPYFFQWFSTSHAYILVSSMVGLMTRGQQGGTHLYDFIRASVLRQSTMENTAWVASFSMLLWRNHFKQTWTLSKGR